jgi:hypothetical protein
MELGTQTPAIETGQPLADAREQATSSSAGLTGSIAQSGATLFAELVWAHHCWQRDRSAEKDPDPALQQAYLDKLAEFQKKEGSLEHVYWSTRDASAVAMTVDPGRVGRLNRIRLHDRNDIIRLHRLTDWVTRDNPAVADLLHECDVLAIRVGEILRGTSERIAMRWILGIEAHLLGFFERRGSKPPKEVEAELVRSQRAKLAEVERYYHEAASRAGRIVYVSGMLIGICIVAILGALAGVLLRVAGLGTAELEILALCFGSGAAGALVSAMSRMGRAERGAFSVDFELGRPLTRRLGVYRPFVGAVFGVVLYFLLKSEILDIQVSTDTQPYYYGFAAFLAGFSERFTTVLFTAAEARLGVGRETTEHPDRSVEKAN